MELSQEDIYNISKQVDEALRSRNMRIEQCREMNGIKVTISLDIDEDKQNVNTELIGFVIDKIGLGAEKLEIKNDGEVENV